MTPKELINRAIKAEALLNDATLTEAFANVRLGILRKIEEAPLRDHDGVHELKLMLKLLHDVRANLTRAVNDGKMAEVQIERENRFTRARKMVGL